MTNIQEHMTERSSRAARGNIERMSNLHINRQAKQERRQTHRGKKTGVNTIKHKYETKTKKIRSQSHIQTDERTEKR